MMPVGVVVILGWFAGATQSAGQDPPSRQGVALAMEGRCPEAMPLLDQAMRDAQAPDSEKRTVSTAGIRCAMLLDRENDAMSFLAWLQQRYPQDPDVLFLAVHVFSDLSRRNANQLLTVAPESALVIQLNAEAFEEQRDLPRAIAEYRVLLQREPTHLSIHYRIGGLLLSSAPDQAKKEFEAELKLNAQNASAEFYLGEIEMQEDHLQLAIAHYQRAIAIYPEFAEAHGRLGRALLDSGTIPEALKPLERAVALKPDDPVFHFALATAYQRSGRKADADREFGLQKSTAEKINQNTKTLRKTVSGAAASDAKQP
jgi:tetratricopeptide (TPR) repeat protein